jgi:hypothetical protein
MNGIKANKTKSDHWSLTKSPKMIRIPIAKQNNTNTAYSLFLKKRVDWSKDCLRKTATSVMIEKFATSHTNYKGGTQNLNKNVTQSSQKNNQYLSQILPGMIVALER